MWFVDVNVILQSDPFLVQENEIQPTHASLAWPRILCATAIIPAFYPSYRAKLG